MAPELWVFLDYRCGSSSDLPSSHQVHWFDQQPGVHQQPGVLESSYVFLIPWGQVNSEVSVALALRCPEGCSVGSGLGQCQSLNKQACPWGPLRAGTFTGKC